MGKPQIAVRIPPPLLAELNQYVTGTTNEEIEDFAYSCSEEVSR